MTLCAASLTAGISSAGTSIARPGKETRYFVIVQCLSFSLDPAHQLPLLVEVEQNVAAGITVELSRLVALGEFHPHIPLAAFAARREMARRFRALGLDVPLRDGDCRSLVRH